MDAKHAESLAGETAAKSATGQPHCDLSKASVSSSRTPAEVAWTLARLHESRLVDSVIPPPWLHELLEHASDRLRCELARWGS